MRTRRIFPFLTMFAGSTLFLVVIAGDFGPQLVEAKSVRTVRSACPSGQVDYGSGLVAHVLPVDVQIRVRALWSCLQAAQASSFLPREKIDPSDPHVSLMYGVQPGNVEILQERLRRRLETHPLPSASLGLALYWDDRERQKTTLALPVVDRHQEWGVLHAILRGDIPERYPFQPHVTIGHLRYGARLSFDMCHEQIDALHAMVWTPCEFVITDHCGQAVWRQPCRADVGPT